MLEQDDGSKEKEERKLLASGGGLFAEVIKDANGDNGQR